MKEGLTLSGVGPKQHVMNSIDNGLSGFTKTQ